MLSNLSMAVAFCNPSELRSTPCDGQSGPLSPRPYHKLAPRGSLGRATCPS